MGAGTNPMDAVRWVIPPTDMTRVSVSKQAGNSATVGCCREWLLRPEDGGSSQGEGICGGV